MGKLSTLPTNSSPALTDTLIGVQSPISTPNDVQVTIQNLFNLLLPNMINNWPSLFNGVISAFSLSTSGVVVSATGTLQPGKYLVIAKVAANPSSGQNGGFSITASGATVGFGYRSGAIHATDADYSTTKWLHRTIFDYITVTTAGSVTVNLYLGVDGSGTFNFCQASDSRWASYIAAIPA